MRRISMHRLQELVRLHRLGEGAREIARQLQMSPNTEREYRQAFAAAGLLKGDPESVPDLARLRELVEANKPARGLPQHESSVEKWRERIESFIEDGATPTAIFDPPVRLRLDVARKDRPQGSGRDCDARLSRGRGQR